MMQRAQGDPTCTLPHQRIELFKSYLRELPAICNKQHVVLDVKYNSVHHIHKLWQTPLTPPPFFQVVRELGIPVIHLFRRNILKTVISNIRADMLRQYIVRSNEKLDSRALDVNPKEVVQRLDTLKRLQHAVLEYIGNYPNVTTVYYEDLFQAPPANNSAQQNVLNLNPSSASRLCSA
jgi:hypothetical protein